MTKTTHAFTLSELILGMAVTSLIGLSAATASSVFGGRYSQSEEYSESVQASRTALRRMRTLVCGAQLILYADANQMLLWREQGVGDGLINRTELVVLTWADGNLAQTQTTVSAMVSLNAVMQAPAGTITGILSNGNTSTSLLASNLTGVTVSLNTAAPWSTEAAIGISSGRGTGAATLRSVASLRSGGRTGTVTYVGGKYYLAGS